MEVLNADITAWDYHTKEINFIFWSYSWLWLIHTVDLVIFWFLSVVCLALVDCSDLSDLSSVVGSDIVSDVSTASSSTFSSSFHCFISSSTLPAVLPLVTPCYINNSQMHMVSLRVSMSIGGSCLTEPGKYTGKPLIALPNWHNGLIYPLFWDNNQTKELCYQYQWGDNCSHYKWQYEL